MERLKISPVFFVIFGYLSLFAEGGQPDFGAPALIKIELPGKLLKIYIKKKLLKYNINVKHRFINTGVKMIFILFHLTFESKEKLNFFKTYLAFEIH